MSTKLSNLFMFVTGAAIGSFVTWKLVKTKYEQIMDEEAASFREIISRKANETDEKKSENKSAESEPTSASDIYEYAKKLRDEDYISEEKGDKNATDDPYVISPDEFDEKGYETVTLTYYADGILSDFSDEVITDIDDVIGVDSLEHFGEYEDDSVFVRNDHMKIDFEILRDYRNYSDVVQDQPSHMDE